jgi:hypothetical protein
MALDANQLRRQALSIAQHPRTRKIAIWVIAIFIAIGVLLGLAAPPLIRGKIAAVLSDKLHREVSIEQLKFNPYTMKTTVRGFLIKERQAQNPALSFDELVVNLEIQSLFRLAPVIKELRLVKPYISVVRNEDLKYSFQDLIDEFSGGPPGPTPRFALNNIEIIDGKLDFDDRPEKTRHTITQLKIGVPFISSLPSYVDITVKPEFSAVVNGAPFHLAGVTAPFKESRDSTLSLDIDKLEIPKYLEYSPVALNFTMPSGQLNGKLTASFKTSKDNSPDLSITGNLRVQELEMRQNGGAPLLKLPNFDVVIGAIEVFASKTTIKSIKSDGLALHVNRGRDGKVNLANLVVPAAENKPTEPKAEPKKEDKPFTYAVEEIALGGATIHFTDEQPKRSYKTRLDNFNFKVTGLGNEAGKKANVEISFESAAKEKFLHAGTLQLTPLLAEGKLDIEGLKPGALRPYYDDAVAAEIKDGFFDLSTQYSFEEKDGPPDIKLTGLSANLRALRLELAGQPEPLWRIGSLAIKNGAVDLTKKTVVIGALEAKDGTGYIQRSADGLNMARIAKAQAPTAAPAQPAKTHGNEWRIDAKQIAFDRFRISVDDQTNAAPAKLSLSGLSIRGANFSTAKNQRGKATIRTRLNEKGMLRLVGTAMVNPVNAKFTVDAQDLEILPFQPFLGDQVNFLLTGGRVGTKGELTFDAGGSGPATMNYRGGVQVAEFGAVEKNGQQELLKWKTLALDALQFDLEPFQLRIGEINLADFYSRLIIGADGKINLQNLTVQKDEQKGEAPAPAKTAEKVQAPAPPKAAEKSAALSTTEAAAPRAISIGKINLQEGNINFSDFFVKPNYSANLTGVEGAISELKPESPGDLDLKARLDNAAPVEIKGKINPLSKELFLDIVADAKEIELSPMSPYSGKYVGYGIEKGKLSFTVKYKLDNRKLTAENRIILNQLTFGDKIESPTATKLPVLLAVALMKDRNGVIDVDLPISGSLDDPQFSVGGIILRIIINLITRAVTAPFTLIASAFGGGGSGDELSYIEFDPGRANLDKADQAKIATLAKALNNRPALNLEITGRVDPLTDLDGLKRVGIERKVKAQKLREMARKGEAPRSVDDVQVAPTEYPQYLKSAYGEESFPKPRNLIGLAQDLPVPEMEKLMMQYAKASDEDIRQLANQRAQAVRDALMATGQAGAERLFVVAAKPFTAEERAKLKGRPNRVDFSMK